MTAVAPFWFRATYWPPRRGPWMWEQFDLDEIRRDLEAVATLGMPSVRLELRWDEFQPDRERVNTAALRRLERLLDLCAELGLSAEAILFPAGRGDLAWLPSWTLSLEPGDGYRIVSGHHAHRRPVRPLFSDGAVLQGQLRLVREAIGAVSGHPSLLSWQLGAGLTELSVPHSEAEAAEWLGPLLESMARARRHELVVLGIGAMDLIDRAWLPLSLIREGAIPLLVISGPSPGWASSNAWPAFLGAYATVLTGLASHVELDATLGTLAETEAASLLESVQTSAAAGCAAPALFSLGPAVADVPLLRGSAGYPTVGLLAADGQPRPAGYAWLEALARRPMVQPERALDEIDLDVWRWDPSEAARLAWRGFAA